jgi:hypothetical protein
VIQFILKIISLYTIAAHLKTFPLQHWLVTDGVWTMEFGSNSRVNVHNHEVRSYIIHRKLTLTPTIRCRMEAVAGGSNYSVFLRNRSIPRSGGGSQ